MSEEMNVKVNNDGDSTGNIPEKTEAPDGAAAWNIQGELGGEKQLRRENVNFQPRSKQVMLDIPDSKVNESGIITVGENNRSYGVEIVAVGQKVEEFEVGDVVILGTNRAIPRIDTDAGKYFLCDENDLLGKYV